jgi:hypothetical protein
VNRVRSRAGASFTPAAALAYDLTVLTARRQHDLPVERVRSRVGAYIYGNILVLAAIFATSSQGIAHWSAVVVVIATSATTFLAHVVAHNTGQAIGRPRDEALRLQLAQEARDAVPIMNSGAGPAVFLALGALGFLPPGFSQVLAEAYVVVRLAGTGDHRAAHLGRRLTPGRALVRIGARRDRRRHRGAEVHSLSLTSARDAHRH